VCAQAFAANYWLRLGASADILNIGLPLYGRSFTLQSPSVSGVGAPANAAGRAGRFTQEDGYLSFYEVNNLETLLHYRVLARNRPIHIVYLMHTHKQRSKMH